MLKKAINGRALAILLATPILTACLSSGGGGGGSDSDGNGEVTSVTGQVINGPVADAVIEIRGPDGELLDTTTSNDSGEFSVTVARPGPYDLRTTYGTLQDAPYLGSLEAHCVEDVTCYVTPVSTAVSDLMNTLQVSHQDARMRLQNSMGIHFDPFVHPDEVQGNFDLVALRAYLDNGGQLLTWVQSLTAWVIDQIGERPVGLIDTTPPIAGIDPDLDVDVDLACTNYELDIDAVDFEVSTYEQMIAALSLDPDGDGPRIIGITEDITITQDQGGAWDYEFDNDLVIVGWKEDGTRPVIDALDQSAILRTESITAALTVSGLEFRNGRNNVSVAQGSIFSRGIGQLTVHDTIFRNNRAREGGAVYTWGSTLITRSEFHGNTVSRFSGAVHAHQGASVCHSVFRDNEQRANLDQEFSQTGGSAIQVRRRFDNQDIGDLVVHDSEFTGNHVGGPRGGALLIAGEGGTTNGMGDIVVTNSIFKDNTSRLGAAAIASDSEVVNVSGGTTIVDGGNITVTNSVFDNNSSDEEGAILEAMHSKLFVYDSLFENNSAATRQSLLLAVSGELCTSTFTDNTNPVFTGEFPDCGDNVFLGSSTDPFAGGLDRIVYVHDGSLYAIDPDGANRSLLVNVSTLTPTPAWSPDGSQIVFADGMPFNSDLWRYTLEEQQLHRLTDQDTVAAMEPAWSADDEIAYVRRAEGQGSNPYLIYVTGPEGGEGSHLTGAQSAHDMERYPHWSPDGQQLVFSVREDWSLDPNSAPLRLYGIGRDGSNRASIAGLANTNQPAWSPDGEQLAYVRNDTVLIRSRDGGDEVVIADGRYPTWSADGLWIAFQRDGNIYRASVEDPGQQPELVTEGEQPNWSR